MLAIICRSYGACRDLDPGSYKDFAPTEHDLGLPNVQTPVTGEDARPTLWRGRPRPRPELRLGASFQGTISLTARRTPASPKALIVGYTPASRRDAQKIGRRFSAGSLRHAIGPVPEGRDEQTGQDDSISRVSRKNPTSSENKGSFGNRIMNGWWTNQPNESSNVQDFVLISSLILDIRNMFSRN